MNKPLLKAALSSDPPLFTDDPIVNHAIDCHMDDQNTPFNVILYEEEIIAWKESGGLILSYKV